MVGPNDDRSPVQDADAITVARVLAGDLEAYALLVARHRDRAVRYAYRMLGNLDDAEDVAQDSFIRAYRSLARCQESAPFDSWLFKILVNRCRTAAVRRNRRRKLFVEEDFERGEAVDRQAHETFREIGSDFEMGEELNRALARLNDAQREAFLLKHVNEMTYDEMATVTGTAVPALKMRVSRACETLRECLSEVYNVS